MKMISCPCLCKLEVQKQTNKLSAVYMYMYMCTYMHAYMYMYMSMAYVLNFCWVKFSFGQIVVVRVTHENLNTQKSGTTNSETSLRSTKRAFISYMCSIHVAYMWLQRAQVLGYLYILIYRKQQWQKCLIVSGGHETPMIAIDAQFIIDMQLLSTILGESLYLNLAIHLSDS